MRHGRLLLAIWTILIVLLVVPWASFQDHAHWSRVAWVPFVSPPLKSGDVVRNLLLYLPWGYLFVRSGRSGASAWRIAGCALALSLATEATQVMSHGRFPSFTDVTCNVAGAWMGARLAARWRRSDR
jgi:glycopeptide antibiotics resistance protein